MIDKEKDKFGTHIVRELYFKEKSRGLFESKITFSCKHELEDKKGKEELPPDPN